MANLDSSSTNISLLSRIRNGGDDSAWREFDERYREMMLRYCRRRGLVLNDAEDVVQATLARLSQSLQRFTYDPERGRFRDYLYRCLRGGLSNWSARSMPAGAAVFNEATMEPAAVESPMDEAWEEEWVAHHYRRAITALRATFDPRNVDMFERNMQGASVELLAVEFGISEQAVYKARQRIRERLEELIAAQIEEEDDVDGKPRAQ